MSRAFRLAPAALLTLCLAYALKAHYAAARPEDLRWLLAPTARVVELAGAPAFTWEAGVGFVSRDLGLALVRGCAGLNFLVVALCSLSIGFLSRFRTALTATLWVPVALGAAYFATILVNAARIGAVILRRELAVSFGLPEHEAHRLEGIVVYLIGLMMLLAVTQIALSGPQPRRWLRNRMACGLACYVGVTLGIPLLRGSEGPGFSAHATLVLGIVGVVAVLVWASAGGATQKRGVCAEYS